MSHTKEFFVVNKKYNPLETFYTSNQIKILKNDIYKKWL